MLLSSTSQKISTWKNLARLAAEAQNGPGLWEFAGVRLSSFSLELSYFFFENWEIQKFCLISRANVALESLKSRIGRSCLLQHFWGKTRSHARHAARRSTALVQTWMDQSETLLLFFAETNQWYSCSRVPQSSWYLSSTCAEELWVEIDCVPLRNHWLFSWRVNLRK